MGNHGVQDNNFIKTTRQTLSIELPDVTWSERIISISDTEKWPYPDNFFDIVISNQVLEHVREHKFFFANCNRVLANGGFSVHLFPVKECFWDGHLHLPFVHWIKTYNFLGSYIRFMSRMGVGKYPSY